MVEVEPGCEALSHGLGSESPGLGGVEVEVEVEGWCASTLRFLSHGLGGAGRPEIIQKKIFNNQEKPRASSTQTKNRKCDSYLTCPFTLVVQAPPRINCKRHLCFR